MLPLILLGLLRFLLGVPTIHIRVTNVTTILIRVTEKRLCCCDCTMNLKFSHSYLMHRDQTNPKKFPS
ncbi:hypothetical protein Lalb_Chr09g0334021 [Lupinus albus]|uniref:Secreted protein n=1 Tax=Lupinus albus TaxID=3870 RepID=A0A6A4Q293_LUPAL|nr:hypothetical protein Lalb_Chr09g0334021 [Lupinus albus]